MTAEGDLPRCSDLSTRRLVVAYDAVLNLAQLPEVRHTVGARVATISPEQVFDVQLVVHELCLTVLARSQLCCGLRVYDCGTAIRVEVDEPAGRLGPPRTAYGIVERLAERRGAEAPSQGVRTGVDPRSGVVTAWCELDVGDRTDRG